MLGRFALSNLEPLPVPAVMGKCSSSARQVLVKCSSSARQVLVKCSPCPELACPHGSERPASATCAWQDRRGDWGLAVED